MKQPRQPDFTAHLLPAIAIYVGICIFGIWIFKREAPRIAEDL